MAIATVVDGGGELAQDQLPFAVDPSLFLGRNRDLIRDAWDAVDGYERSVIDLDTNRLLGRLSEEDTALAGVTRHEYTRAFLRRSDALPAAVAAEFGEGAQLVMGSRVYTVYRGTLIAEYQRETDEKEGATVTKKTTTVTAVFGDYEINSIEFGKGFARAANDEWRGMFTDMLVSAGR